MDGPLLSCLLACLTQVKTKIIMELQAMSSANGLATKIFKEVFLTRRVSFEKIFFRDFLLVRFSFEKIFLFPSISYYFHIPKIFLIFFLTLEKIGIDEKVICYHNISS